MSARGREQNDLGRTLRPWRAKTVRTAETAATATEEGESDEEVGASDFEHQDDGVDIEYFPRVERPLPCPRADPEGCPIVRETPLKKERLHCGRFRYADGSVNSKTIGYAVRGDWEVPKCVLSGLGRMSAVRVGGAEMVGRRRNVVYVFG